MSIARRGQVSLSHTPIDRPYFNCEPLFISNVLRGQMQAFYFPGNHFITGVAIF
jgi:hypothetical protein